jgi:FKBP-type peptidyl-prolyl cis-trans isomerase SlyD
MSTIAEATVVEINYILRTDAGEILDQSEPGSPLSYLHGAQNIVPGLENALTGRRIGEQLTVRVSPQEGYGERMPDATRQIPRSAFPARMPLQVQAQLVLADESGRRFPVWIAEVGPDVVVVDLNHPLAGAHLNFDVTVISVRPASEEELAHGHPHGPGGHDH